MKHRQLNHRYRIIRELGQGGMSTVYLAADNQLGAVWAVKCIAVQALFEFSCFQREMTLLAKLHHPGIPRIVDSFYDQDYYYVVMDYIEGMSLRDKLTTETDLGTEQIIQWGIQLSYIIQYLHSLEPYPVIYGDIKPDNIIIGCDDRVYLIDFGTAFFYDAGTPCRGTGMGTPGFAAPEQYGGRIAVDFRTDIYGIGKTLASLLEQDAVYRKLSFFSANNSELLRIITRCTNTEPDCRYQSCTELISQLSDLLQGDKKNWRRLRISRWLSVLLIIIGISLSILSYYNWAALREDSYRELIRSADNYIAKEDYPGARLYYQQAIELKPWAGDNYRMIFDCLIEEFNVTGDNIRLIEQFYQSYLLNESTPIYNNPELTMEIVRIYIQTGNPLYARKALDYMELLILESEYSIDIERLKAYETIAVFAAGQDGNTGLDDLREALILLEQLCDNGSESIDEQLSMYCFLINLYRAYMWQDSSGYDEIYRLSRKFRHRLTEEYTEAGFSLNIANRLCRLMILSISQFKSINNIDNERWYIESFDWFTVLEELSLPLDINLLMEKGNTYKYLFDLDIAHSRAEGIRSNYLVAAAEAYEDAAKLYESALAYIFWGQALLDYQFIEESPYRYFEQATNCYFAAESLIKADEVVTDYLLTQLKLFKQRLALLGMEV